MIKTFVVVCFTVIIPSIINSLRLTCTNKTQRVMETPNYPGNPV